MLNTNKIIMVVLIVQVIVISLFTKSKESQMELLNSNIKQNHNSMMEWIKKKCYNIHYPIKSLILFILF